MAEEKTVEARMNLSPTPESFQSMSEFVAMAERAAAAAKATRESLHGARSPEERRGASPNTDAFGVTNASVPYQSEIRRHPNLGYGGEGQTNAQLSQSIRDLADTQREVLRIIQAGRYNPPASPVPFPTRAAPTAATQTEINRHNPDLDAVFGVPTTTSAARTALPQPIPPSQRPDTQGLSPLLGDLFGGVHPTGARSDPNYHTASPPSLGAIGGARNDDMRQNTDALRRLTRAVEQQIRGVGSVSGTGGTHTAMPSSQPVPPSQQAAARTYGLLPQEGESKTPRYDIERNQGESVAEAYARQIKVKLPKRVFEELSPAIPPNPAYQESRVGNQTSAELDPNEIQAAIRKSKENTWLGKTGQFIKESMGSNRFLSLNPGRAMAIGATGAVAANGALDAANSVNYAEATGATGDEMQRALIGNMPVLGYGQRQIDRLRGRSTDIAIQQVRGQFGMNAAENRANMDTAQAGFAMDRAPLDAAVQVRRNDLRYASVGVIDRSTVAGKQKHFEAEMMRPVEQNRIEAEKKLTAEQDGLAILQKQEQETKQKLAMAERERGKYSPNNPNRPTGAAGQEYLNKGRESQVQVEALTEQLKQLGGKIENQKGGVANAQVNLNQVSAQEMQTRLQIGEHKENQARGQAKRLGSMNAMERSMAIDAAKQLQAIGDADAVPQEMLEMARGASPELVAELEEKRGVKAIRDNNLVGGPLQEYQVDLRAQEESNAKMRDSFSKMQTELAAKSAELLANLIGPDFVKSMLDALRRGMEANNHKLQSQLNEKNIAP